MASSICTTSPPHWYYTDAEIDAANDTDLPDLLAYLGYQVRRISSYYTTREMDSLMIKNRRTWKRYSNGKGGDAITFLQEFCGMRFPEAVDYLLAYHGRSRDSPDRNKPIPRPKPPPPREKPPFVLPPANPDQRRVFAYLRKRGIAPKVIRAFMEAGLLYEDAQYHNCVFVGQDGAGKAVFAAKRGTYYRGGAAFRGDVAGSDKSVAFRTPCDPVLDAVCVFEAPIDLMSWFTLYGKTNALALCGLYDAPLDTYLRENPHLRRIILCLDADGRGRETSRKLVAKYQNLGYETEEQIPPSGKDWNEYLQKQNAA